MDTEREIERILEAFPERFSEMDKEGIRSGRYEIRQCTVCGDFMADGFYFEDGTYYCSERCMWEDGISKKDYLAYSYGLAPCDISEEVRALPYPKFRDWCIKNGNEDEAIGYYTEWDCPIDLIDRLNRCRGILNGTRPRDREEALDGFFSYWKEEVLPLYEDDEELLCSFEDALGGASPYRRGSRYMSWEDAIKEA